MIRLRRVAVHNLQNVDLDLPLGRLIALCGVSGSGKTSLALDTLHAEGQRRYIESFSNYARQFLQQFDKPEAESIEGIPPSILVSRTSTSPRSQATVGSTTHINEHLQVLLSRAGELLCNRCGQKVAQDSADSAADLLAASSEAGILMIGFMSNRGQDRDSHTWLANLKSLGMRRAVLGDHTVRMDELDANLLREHDCLPILLDRLTQPFSDTRRLHDSLESALELGRGRCITWIQSSAASNRPAADDCVHLDQRIWKRQSFSRQFRCDACELDFPKPEPQLLNPSSPLGACPECEGFGNCVGMDSAEIDLDRSISYQCRACHGTRLRPEALTIRLAGKNIVDLWKMKISNTLHWFRHVELSIWQRHVGRLLLEQVTTRLEYLQEIGVGHLTLDRPLRTLSSGERQRVALTSALGSNLVGMLYLLDEPSAGLHPAEIPRLVSALAKLRNRGNSVVVIEHEHSVIRAADQIVELGPGAGEQGGHLLFQGTLEELLTTPGSQTGNWLAGRRHWNHGSGRRPTDRGTIRLIGARGNHLSNLTVEFPLGVLCLVTGVSGAGKSTLVRQTLYPAAARRLRIDAENPAPHDDILGVGQIEDVVLIDQSPIGRTPRSNAITYIKAFDLIRKAFAGSAEAQSRGFKAGHFSFNVDGGRCETCKGEGFTRIDMRLMADVLMRCPECSGLRYRREVLEVKYRNCNIAEVLALSVREAFHFFRGHPKILSRLKPLLDVGLEYLQLGQPATTLSGGEAQRLKLATYLSSARRGRTLFVLDEPTTGLHDSDVLKLLDCFESLLSMGHSLVAADHNRLLIQSADHIIDLGPGAADAGGDIVAEGTPEVIATNPKSITGRYLKTERQP